MARTKDVVFSSEKLESRERLKALLTPVAVLLVIVALVVISAFVLNDLRGKSYSGGEDTAYPYTWRNNNKGVMTVEIDNKADPSRSWIVLDTDPVRYPSQAAEKQPRGKNRFLITPRSEGIHNALFLLTDESGEPAAVLEMIMESEVNSKGRYVTDVVTSSLKYRQLAGSGGEESYYPYSFATGEGEVIALTVANAATLPDWVCSCSNEQAVENTGIFYRGGDLLLYFSSASDPGSCTVSVSSESGGVTIELDMEYTLNGELMVTDHRIIGGTEPPKELPPEDLSGGEDSGEEAAAELPPAAGYSNSSDAELSEDTEDNSPDQSKLDEALRRLEELKRGGYPSEGGQEEAEDGSEAGEGGSPEASGGEAQP